MQGAWQNGTNVYAVRGTYTSGTSTAQLTSNLYIASGTGWAQSGTFVSTIYYSGLGIGTAVGTASVNVSGQMIISSMASGGGTFTKGMSLADANGTSGLPTNATVVSILSGTGGVGTLQISPNPAVQVVSETIYGLNSSYNLPTTGQIVKGATSGAQALLYQAVPLDSSSGYLAFLSVNGTFANGENLEVGSNVFAVAASACTKFTLPPSGFYRWRNYNFLANSSAYYTYGVSGAGPAFQIDNNNVVMPILLPQSAIPNQPVDNTPFLLEVYQNYLCLAFPGGNFQMSVAGVPYQFNGFLGAEQIGVGAEITGMHSIVGPGLAILTSRNSQIMSGNTPATFQLTLAAEHAGSVKYGSLSLDTVYALNSLGITSLSRTQSYGNFVGATVSQLVQPMVQALYPHFTDATLVRRSNQARIYFDSGDTISMYVPGLGQQNKAWSGIETGITAQFGHHVYPAPVYNTCNTEDQNGNETSYFGSTNQDGYVYQARSGASWDGFPITSYLRLVFNNLSSPAIRKYYRRADIELNSPAQINLKFAADLSYSNTESSSAIANETATNIPSLTVFGGGGYWDTVYWNEFNWDSQNIATARASLSGTGENVSFLIFHQSIVDTPFVLQGLTLHFDPRRPQR